MKLQDKLAVCFFSTLILVVAGTLGALLLYFTLMALGLDAAQSPVLAVLLYVPGAAM